MITRDIPTPLLSFPVLMGAVRLLAVWRLLGGDPVVPQREENDIKKARGFLTGKRILAGCGIPFSFGRRAPAGRGEREPISPAGTLGFTGTMGTSGGSAGTACGFLTGSHKSHIEALSNSEQKALSGSKTSANRKRQRARGGFVPSGNLVDADQEAAENTSHRTNIGLEDLSALRRGTETSSQVRARSPPYVGCHIAGRMEAASTRRTPAIGRIRVRRLKRIEEKDGDLHPSTKQGILRTSDATSQEGWKLYQYGGQHLQDGYRIRRLKH